MQAVQDEMETIHLYVVKEQPKKPYTVLPLLCAFLCLVGMAAITLYSAEHPSYEHQRLLVAPTLLPLKVFTATVPITPTGVKVVAPTYAHGVLTITNGSIVSQTLPAGFNFITNRGVQVFIDNSIFVPPGNVNGYGYATTAAHLSTPGINLPTLAVDQVLGTSLYIRNLQPFTGGHPARTITFITARDRQAALLRARGILLSKSSGLHYPCAEDRFLSTSVKITWQCQFVSYHIPASYHVTAVRLSGKNLIVDVWFIPRVQYAPFK